MWRAVVAVPSSGCTDERDDVGVALLQEEWPGQLVDRFRHSFRERRGGALGNAVAPEHDVVRRSGYQGEADLVASLDGDGGGGEAIPAGISDHLHVDRLDGCADRGWRDPVG